MAGPYGIEQFDAGNALAMYRQGRQDRVRDLEYQREQDRRAAMAKIFTPPTAAGTPPIRGPVDSGTDLPSGPQMPSSLVDPSKLPARTDSININHDALRDLYRVDPEYAMEVQKWAFSANKQQMDTAAQNGRVMATLAGQLRTVPVEQRSAYLAQVAPQLAQMGFSTQQLSQADLSDNGLQQYERIGTLLDAIQGKSNLDVRNVDAGANVIGVDPRTGSVRELYKSPYIKGADGRIYGPEGGAAASGQAPARITDKSAYDALPPGTTYIAPDGSTRTKPGGPTRAASGGFPLR